MLLSLTLVSVIGLGVAMLLLLVAGRRLRFASGFLGIAAAVVVALLSGQLASWSWSLPLEHVLFAEAWLTGCGVIIVILCRRWNAIGQVFFATFVASAFAYLAFAAQVTIAGGLSAFGVAASSLLWLLELGALVIAGAFAFESIDVTCRTAWFRSIPTPDPAYLPMVSLHVPAYNEPPEMLIETIASLERLDYPNFEIVVVDNNTRDAAVWEPVEAYCRDHPRVRFTHVDPWPGYKSGALNLALQLTHPRAEVIGVVDADYVVRPDYLRRLVGHFADPSLAFVQTPQDYREWEGDAYLTACYDAYKYFFETAMPSRNERNSIIFGGTMGLIRRSALTELGGWDEWCITEDAEASLRMLKAGYAGLYVNESFGRGIMPLTFTALKRQRFRWCFGGVQILRKHWRSLAPWDRSLDNRLSMRQRIDYAVGGFQWFGDFLSLGFTLILGVSALLLLARGRVALRPLLGAAVLLPAALLLSGLVRAIWALRNRTKIGLGRATMAFTNWLSLSWTVGLACIRGLTRREGVFLRTPKWKEGPRLEEALRETRVETTFAVALWTAAAAVALSAHPSPFLIGLLAWQGMVYASSPYMAWLNHRSKLSARLERRQRTEDRRERIMSFRPHLVGAGAVAAVLGLAFVAVLAVGGARPGRPHESLFEIPRAPEQSTHQGGGLAGDTGGQVSVPAQGGSPSEGSLEDAAPNNSGSSGPGSTSFPIVAPTASTNPTPQGTTPGGRPTSTPTPSAEPGSKSTSHPTPTARPTRQPSTTPSPH